VVIQLAAMQDAFALDGHRGIAQYAQTHYESRDGLPHALASSMAQTPDGYLWTTSEEGLTRYDGATFTTFDHRNTAGIPDNYFTAVAVDPAGGLWAGTRDHGLVRMVDGEFRTVVWGAGAQDAQIRTLVFDRDGDLWVALFHDGLVRLRSGELVTTLATRDGLPSEDIRSLLTARDGTVWVATFRGLVPLSHGRIARGPPALDGLAINGLAQDARGDLWCATGKGLAHLHGDTVDWVAADRLASMDLRKLLFDRDSCCAPAGAPPEIS
jgi:ligand-binding sensor domain-containing protein